MYFEEQLVVELEEFVIKRLLNGAWGPLPSGSITIGDLRMAELVATDGRPQHPANLWTVAELEDWGYLRDRLNFELSYFDSNSRAGLPQTYEELKVGEFRAQWRNEANKYLDRIFHVVRRKARDFKIKEIEDQLNPDMELLLYWRHYRVFKCELMDLMHKSYRAGGWPCGWKGRYPEGNIIVYWPYDTPPEFEK